MGKRVLICGSRGWTNERLIGAVVAALPPGTVVIHGAARGADSIAGRAAEQCGLPVEQYPAEWRRYGRAAGHRRNTQMLTDGRPDLVIAFRLDGPSKGTDNMIAQARSAGIRVQVVREP